MGVYPTLQTISISCKISVLGRIVEAHGEFHLYRQNERGQVGDQGIVNEFSFFKNNSGWVPGG